MTISQIANIEDERDCCKSTICENVKLVVASMVVVVLVLVILVCISLSYCTLQVFPAVNYILMLLCLTLLAYVEALHYAVVSVEKWDMTIYKERYPRAVKVHSLVDTPKKVKKFLVGRQFFVIFVVFLLAQITTFPCKKSIIQIICNSIQLLYRHSEQFRRTSNDFDFDSNSNRTTWYCTNFDIRSTGKIICYEYEYIFNHDTRITTGQSNLCGGVHFAISQYVRM